MMGNHREFLARVSTAIYTARWKGLPLTFLAKKNALPLAAFVHLAWARRIQTAQRGQRPRSSNNFPRDQNSAVWPQRHRPRPVVACSRKALWVEPDLYCRVRSLQWTQDGLLRGASFHGLLDAQA